MCKILQQPFVGPIFFYSNHYNINQIFCRLPCSRQETHPQRILISKTQGPIPYVTFGLGLPRVVPSRCGDWSPVKRPKSKSAGKLGELVYFSRFLKKGKRVHAGGETGFSAAGGAAASHTLPDFYHSRLPGARLRAVTRNSLTLHSKARLAGGSGGWRGVDPV